MIHALQHDPRSAESDIPIHSIIDNGVYTIVCVPNRQSLTKLGRRSIMYMYNGTLVISGKEHNTSSCIILDSH